MSDSQLRELSARQADLREGQSTTQQVSLPHDEELLGEKTNIRKTLVRHVVLRVVADFPGRRFNQLSILELGAGAGFFAETYAELFPDQRLEHHVQTDKDPQSSNITQLDVCDLLSSCTAAEFDVVLSVDFLSCLSFGAGLDPDDPDDVDELGLLDEGLLHVLKPGGAFYDFMASVP